MEDIETQKHAYIIARDYNIAPYDDLKTERVIPRSTDLNSVWLAKKDRTARSFVQYHADQIGKKLIEGEPCTQCWAESKFWKDETIPKYVFCALSGFEEPVSFLNTVFEPGEPIKLGVYMLEQKNCPDCTYEYLDGTKEIIWTPDDVLSTLVVTTKPDDIVRMDAGAGGCFRRFQEYPRRAEISCC